MPTSVSGYRLDHLLRRGQDHDVWLARSPSSDQPVVIKRGASATGACDARSLMREAGVLSTLAHPNVVGLLEVVDDPPGQMLVLAPVEGGSLRDLLDERGTLTPGELVALFHGVAAAVDHLADRGLVHGNLRPEHILLTAQGMPVLVGFGAATSGPAASAGSRIGGRSLHADGPPPGGVDDPTYRHPAVVAGGLPAASSEVFSLGVVAYECLTGRVPHRGTPAEVVALAAAGVHRPLSSWPSVPPGMAEVVERVLTSDGPDVPVDMTAFVERLREVVDPATVVRPRPRIDPTMARPGPTADETLPFGPTPPVDADAPAAPEVWRVVAAAVIATVVVAGLWFLAGVALGV